MTDDLARGFAEALGQKDSARLKALLRPDVNFKGLTPGRFWEATSSDELVDDILLGTWFTPSNVIDEVISVEVETVGNLRRVGYQFRVMTPNGAHMVEQQAYVDSDGEQIHSLRVLCAGYQRIE